MQAISLLLAGNFCLNLSCSPWLESRPRRESCPQYGSRFAELEAAFSERTKAILVNSPHNPTGKVFSKEDLQFIADLCQKWNVYAILDEVSNSARCLILLLCWCPVWACDSYSS